MTTEAEAQPVILWFRQDLRLADNPAVYRVPTEPVELFAIGDFLTEDECTQLCAMIDAVARAYR